MDGSAEPEAPPHDEKPAVINNETHTRYPSSDSVIHNEPTDYGITKTDAEPKNDTESSNMPAVAQETTAQILEFFANAPDGVLVVVALAFASVLYAIFGQIGLLAIGITAGILLHAHWAGLHGEKEVGIAQLEKVLEAKGTQKIKSMLDVDEEEMDKQEIGFKDFKPETAKALDEIVARTIDDYVRYWYSPMHPGEESVPRSAKATLVQFIRSVSRTLSKKRPADAFILFLTNTSSIVTTFFSELGNAIKESQDIDVAPQDAVGLYLSEHPDSTLSYLLDEKQQHTRFLREADEMLRHHIDKSVYNCNFAKTFLQQTLCCDVFETTLKTISKPEWFNGWIVYLLEEGEPDLLQAIDAGMSNESKAAMKPKKESKTTTDEKRMSRAVDDQAMEEARRLSELMAEEDTRRAREAADVSPPIVERPSQAPAPEPPVEDTTTRTLSPRPDVEHSHAKKESTSTFTSFDQLPTSKVIAEEPAQMPLSAPASAIPPLTLHNANITILDDSMPDDKDRSLRSKPFGDYLVQIEPQDSRHPGWMIVRRYDDFETLHEVLKRIAQVSGAANFTKNHANLPTWKGETKAGLRIGLENYLMSACTYRPLAESEGLKRFLEKEHQRPTGKGSPGIGWPTPQAFENMGKGVVDSLMTVNKGAADGAKTVFGGMAGVFTGNRNRGDSKARNTSVSTTSLPLQLDGANGNSVSPARTSTGSTLAGRERSDSKSSSRPSIVSRSSTSLPGLTEEAPITNDPLAPSKRDSTLLSFATNGTSPVSLQNAVESFMGSPVETKTANRDSLQVENNAVGTSSSRTSISDVPSNSKASIGDASQDAALDIDSLHLPPPPSDMPDDYLGGDGAAEITSPILARAPSHSQPGTSVDAFSSTTSAPAAATPKFKLEKKEPEPFTEQETRDTLELIFAMISSLYTLSSAWGLRLTLLTAAKTFLLRPGNPSLLYIQKLVQDDVIKANTSDEGMASHIRKIRENSLPTAEELKSWPAEMTAVDKEELRRKARSLLLARGVPAALTGVMGNPATSQALGRVFDALQDERVLRGLMFGLLMQGVSLVSH